MNKQIVDIGTCVQCGVAMRETQPRRGRPRLFCSSACSNKNYYDRTYVRKPVPDRSCQHCGQVIVSEQYNKAYCDDDCKRFYKKSMRDAKRTELLDSRPPRQCVVCAGPISREKNTNAVYCGSDCRLVAQKRRLAGV